MGSYEEWYERDQLWIAENLPLARETYQWFLRNGDWPETGELQHHLYKQGDRTTEVQTIADKLPRFPGQFAPAHVQKIALSARHLLQIPEACYLLQLTVQVAQLAVEAFLSAERPGQITIAQQDVPVSTPGETGLLPRVGAFALSDHPTPFAGGSCGENWTLGVSDSLVMRFEEVRDPEDYVARQLSVIHEWSEQYDNQRGVVKRGGPYRAFLVMAFHEEWSETSHAFILQGLEGVDEQVVAVRADEIVEPGRITDQIADQLETCDFIVADITGNNANVGWELGFAYARSKPCVIVRRRDYTVSAPFDIYDQRRVDYSSAPTPVEHAAFRGMLDAAIDQVKMSSGSLGNIFKQS